MSKENEQPDHASDLKNAELMYLFALSIVQPTRIQELTKMVNEYFQSHQRLPYFNEKITDIHYSMRSRSIAISVRRGVYCLSTLGRKLVRDLTLHKASANERFF